MITGFLLAMIAGIVQGLLAIIPSWSVDTSQIDTARTAGLNFGSLDGWFPLSFLLACLAVVMAVRGFFLVWNALVWLYHMIPFN